MISAATIRLLVEAGVTGETLVRVIESMEADGNAVTVTRGNAVTYNAQKQARYRLRKKVTEVTGVTDPLPPRTRARGVVSSSSTEITGKKVKKDRPTEVELRTELETVLDPEHAAAVVEHRERKKPFNTLQGARALAGKFAKCSDPNAAADTMLANDWIGIEASWLEPRRPNGTGPPPKPMTGSAKLAALCDVPLEETYARNRSSQPAETPVLAIRDRR